MRPRNPNLELKACWSKREDDIIVYYPDSPDGHLMHDMLNSRRLRSGFTKNHSKNKRITIQDWNANLCIYEDKSFLEELESRGYDLKTLKISVRKREKK